MTANIIFIIIVFLQLTSCIQEGNARKDNESLKSDFDVEKVVEAYLKSYNIDSIETEEEKRTRVREEVKKGHILINSETGQIERRSADSNIGNEK